MVLHLLLLIFLVQQNAGAETNGTDNYFLRVLDGLEFIHTGREKYDRIIYGELTTCMNRIDPTLIDFLDNAWKSVVEFWVERKDEWGKDLSYTAGNGDLWERNPTLVPNLEGLVVQEPCNVASMQSMLKNILKFCERMDEDPGFNSAERKVKIYGKLIVQSVFAGSFYHGTRSHFTSSMVGPLATQINHVLFNNLVEFLPTNSINVKSLGKKTRRNADQIVDTYHRVLIEEKYEKWPQEILYHNAKDYKQCLLGIISIFTCILEPTNPIELFERVFEYLSYFLRIPDGMKNFFILTFIPEVQDIVPLMNLTTAEVETLRRRSYYVAAIYAYSIIYKGEVPMKKTFDIAKYPGSNPDEFFAKKLLRMKIPFSSFVAEMAFQNKFYVDDSEIYSGGKECKLKYGHPKSHEIARQALLEAIFLMDDIRGILKKKDLFGKKETDEVSKPSQEKEEVNKFKSEKETNDQSSSSPSSALKEETITNKRNTIVITLS